MARVIYQDAFDREELEGEIDFNRALQILKGFMGIEDTLDCLKVSIFVVLTIVKKKAIIKPPTVPMTDNIIV